MKTFLHVLMASTALALPVSARAQTPVGATESPSAAPAEGLADITVTARRQSENLQRTPVAITAFDAQAITRSAAPDLRGIVNQAPNVNLQAGGNSSGGNNTQIFIRGVGQDDFLPTSDPGVGVYVDGVYLGRSVGGLLKSSDLAQIEVLRGPQGTLFGRNTIGGAINIRTTDPSFDAAHGYAEGTIGDDGLYGINAAIGGPVSDTLALRLSGGYRTRDGYDRSVTDGTKFGNENYGLIRGKLAWRPTSDLTISLGGDYYKQRQHNMPVSVLGVACANGTFGACPDQPGSTIPAVAPSGLISLYNNFVGGPSGKPFTNANLRTYDEPFDTAATGPSRDDAEAGGVSGTIEYRTSSALTFKSITAYRKLNARFSSDNDGGAQRVAETADRFNQHQFSQELQALVALDRLKGVFGLYYFTETSRDRNDVAITPGLYPTLEAFPLLVGSTLVAPPGLPGVPCGAVTFAPVTGTPFRSAVDPTTSTPAGGFGCSRNIANTSLDNELYIDQTVRVKNYAAFGQASYRVTDKLSLTAGLRFTYEEKSIAYLQQRVAVSASLGVPFYAVAPTSRSKDFSNFSPRVGAEYQFDRDVLGYVSFAKGFKSGTFNGRSTSTQGVAPVAPEKVDQYEAGLKTQFAQNRVRLNLAGFYSNYTDLQLQSVVSDPNLGLLINLVNAGKARIFGFEAEVLARPLPALELGLNGGYVNSRITSIDPAVAAATGVREGNRLRKSPDWNFTASAQYTRAIAAAGDLALRVEYRHVGKQYHDAANNADTVEDPYGLLNARLGFTTADRHVEVAVYGRNLTDQTYYNALFRTGGGETVGYAARRREIGATVRLGF